MVKGGMSCVKYLLGVFNFAFFLSSIGIIVLCVRSIGMPESAEKILDVNNRHLIVMIAAAVVLLIISFLGCWGALRENHCMLISYGVLLLIIMLVEVAVGTLAFLYSNSKVKELAYEAMNETMSKYEMDNENSTTTRLIDDLQKNVKCCGIYNYTDFTNKFGQIPLSCCGKLKAVSVINPITDGMNATGTPRPAGSNETCSANEAFTEGCGHKLWDLMVKYYGPIGGILIGVAVIQLLGCILSCAFAHSIKRGYEVV